MIMENVTVVKKHVEKMKGKRIKLATIGVIFMSVVILCAGGLVTYWTYSATNVLTINNDPFPVRMNGDVVIMEVDYCKNIKVKGSLRMSYISATSETFLPMVEESGPKQCLKTEFPILIPKTLPSDTYRVKFRVTYNVNPVKKGVIREFESQEFIVNE